MKPKYYVKQEFIELNKKHLTEEDFNILNNLDSYWISKHFYGLFVKVIQPVHGIALNSIMSYIGTSNHFNQLYAHCINNNIKLIIFDRDVEPVRDFPVFDWKENFNE
jgi:hypothetical protein